MGTSFATTGNSANPAQKRLTMIVAIDAHQLREGNMPLTQLPEPQGEMLVL